MNMFDGNITNWGYIFFFLSLQKFQSVRIEYITSFGYTVYYTIVT